MPVTSPLRVVITGTDTGVGKTFVGCALARALVARGIQTLAVKPVESGCAELASTEENGCLLAAATGQPQPLAALVRLAQPLAPPVAAALEGLELSLEDWVGRITALERATFEDAAAAFEDVAPESPAPRVPGITLVEGAGGLLSPLTATADTRDLIRALGAEVLLVTANRLGTLNHTRLTFEALESHGIAVHTVVLSACGDPDTSAASNGAELGRWLPVPIIELPRDDEEAASGQLDGIAEALSTAVMSRPSGVV